MNKNAQYYYKNALKLLLPVEEVPEIDGFKLILGKTNYYFCHSGTPLNNSGSIYVARNKYCMNKILEKAGLPVPKAVFVNFTEFQAGKLEEKIASLSFPLVAKPQAGKLGQDVLCNIQNIQQLTNYMIKNFSYYDSVAIEEFHGNLNSYRVLILNNRVLGVIQRYPAHVIGDGKHNLQELIELTNIQRRQISDTLGPIVVDEECHIRLNELGISLSYVPKNGEWVTLIYTSNATRGGTYKSLGKQICKENRQLLIRAATELQLKLVGFDVQCADIQLPIEKPRDVIIEANDAPSVRIHESPMEGSPVYMSKKILRQLIYRHPFAYFHVLYKNQQSAFYVRSILFAACLGLMYYGFHRMPI